MTDKIDVKYVKSIREKATAEISESYLVHFLTIQRRSREELFSGEHGCHSGRLFLCGVFLLFVI